MSPGCRTPGRLNSWVIRIHLSLSLPHFLLSFFSFYALTWVGSSLPIEVLNPSLKLQAAQSIHQKHDPLSLSAVRDKMLWTNERMCAVSLYTGEEIFTYYRPSQHIKQTCIVFQYKRKSPPLSVIVVSVLVWKGSCSASVFIQSFANFFPRKAIKLMCNEQHCGRIPLWIFIVPYIICKLM